MGTVEAPHRNFKKRALIARGYTYPQYWPAFGILPCTSTKHQVGWDDGGLVGGVVEATDSTDDCDGEYQIRVTDLMVTVPQIYASQYKRATPDTDINIDTSPSFIPEYVGSTLKIQTIDEVIPPDEVYDPPLPPTYSRAKTFWYNVVGDMEEGYGGYAPSDGTGMGFTMGSNGPYDLLAKPYIHTNPPNTWINEYKVRYYQTKVGHIPSNITLPIYTPRLFSITGGVYTPGGNTDVHMITGIIKEYKGGQYTPNGVHSFAVSSDGSNPQYFVIADDTDWISYGTDYITDFNLTDESGQSLQLDEPLSYWGSGVYPDDSYYGINQPIPWFGTVTIKRAAGWGWTERFGREMETSSVLIRHSGDIEPVVFWSDSYDWDGVKRQENTTMTVVVPFSIIGQKEYRVRVDVKDHILTCHELGWVYVPPVPPATGLGTWVWGELPY